MKRLGRIGMVDAPRIADAVPGFEVTGRFGTRGHRAMPDELRKRWSDAIGQTGQEESLRQRLMGLGFTPHFEDTAPWPQIMRPELLPSSCVS